MRGLFVRSLFCLLLASSSCVLAAAPPDGLTLMGIEYSTGNLYRISGTDASMTLVGSAGGGGWGGMEFAPDGKLYAFRTVFSQTGDDVALYRIDPGTAAATRIGTMYFDGLGEGALAISPDGTGYAATTSIGNSLLKVNLATGAGTSVGHLWDGQHAFDINGLAWRSDGKMVGLDGRSNSLVLVDPATALVSAFTPVSDAVGAVGGMTAVGDVGYFVTAGPGASLVGSNKLYQFDMYTGQATPIGSLAPTISGTGISGLTAFVPEPVSFAAMLLASVAALRRSRTRPLVA